MAEQTQASTKPAEPEEVKYATTTEGLGALETKAANEEFKLREHPLKTSDTPGKSRFPHAPSNYIVVNDSSLVNGTGERSLILLIDWNTFIEDVVAHDEQKEGTKIHKSALYAAYTKAVKEVLARLTKNNNNVISTEREHLLNMYVNRSILELKTTLTNNLAGNSCSFSLENFDDKWIVLDKKNPFWGQSIIQEGMRFIVEGRGRFKPNNFYRQFTGYITGINEKSNPTDKSLSYSCADASRTLKYTRYNVSPAIYTGDPFTKQKKPVLSKTNLVGMNGAEIIKKVVLSDAKTDRYELDNAYQWQIEMDDVVKKSSTKGGKSNIGLPLEEKTGILDSKYRRNWHIISGAERYKSYTYASDSDKKDVLPRALLWGHTGDVYTFMFGQLKLRFDEFQTKADILNNLANLTHYVTYIDGAGNLHYHPPRFESEYELMIDGVDGDSMEHPLTYSVFDDETITQSYSQNEGEVCTMARGMGEGNFGIPKQIMESGAEPNYARANIAWVDGVSRFGFRERKISTAAFLNVELLTLFTAGFLIRANQERYQMTAQMIMRPELQPDRPIYDYTKNKWYNIRSVTHTYMAGGPNSGGSYTTDIICYAGRNPGENVAANLFAAAKKETIDNTEKMKEFLAKYSKYYNLEDFGSMDEVKRKDDKKEGA